MKKIQADPLLDEVEAAQRKLEAEFDNDPAKLLAYFEEQQKRYAHRLVSRHATGRVTQTAQTGTPNEAGTGQSAA